LAVFPGPGHRPGHVSLAAEIWDADDPLPPVARPAVTDELLVSEESCAKSLELAK